MQCFCKTRFFSTSSAIFSEFSLISSVLMLMVKFWVGFPLRDDDTTRFEACFLFARKHRNKCHQEEQGACYRETRTVKLEVASHIQKDRLCGTFPIYACFVKSGLNGPFLFYCVQNEKLQSPDPPKSSTSTTPYAEWFSIQCRTQRSYYYPSHSCTCFLSLLTMKLFSTNQQSISVPLKLHEILLCFFWAPTCLPFFQSPPFLSPLIFRYSYRTLHFYSTTTSFELGVKHIFYLIYFNFFRRDSNGLHISNAKFPVRSKRNGNCKYWLVFFANTNTKH